MVTDAQRVLKSLAKNVRKNGGEAITLLAKRHEDKVKVEEDLSKTYTFLDGSTIKIVNGEIQ